MISKYNTALEAKVGARNAVNALANQFSPVILEALKPLIGVKCFNQGNIISQKLRAILPELPNAVEARARYTTGHGYTLRVVFNTSTMFPDCTGHHCLIACAEEHVYLADIQQHTIEKFYDFQPRRIDYTVDEVLASREELKYAKGMVIRAESKLIQFGEYD